MKAREMPGLADMIFKTDGGLEQGARHLGLDDDMRMHERAMKPVRDRNRRHGSRLERERESALEARGRVVGMRGTARDGLAFQREGKLLLARKRRAKQRIGRDDRGDGGRGRAAHAGAERDPLFDPRRESHVQAEL